MPRVVNSQYVFENFHDVFLRLTKKKCYLVPMVVKRSSQREKTT